MEFEKAINTFPTILQNGPIGTRLKYQYGYESAFDLTMQTKGRRVLTSIYEEDILVSQKYHLPIIINAPTFRANKNHLKIDGCESDIDVEDINKSCINFVKIIQTAYAKPNTPVFIGAPLGSMYDAYSLELRPSIKGAKLYHQQQIDIFKKLGVDFVNAVTIPSLDEATGIALAAEQADIQYTIGFILNNNGTLLDHTPLKQAIDFIDMKTRKKPLGYLITCTHTSIIKQLTGAPNDYNRLIGIQPNGSHLPPEKLAAMEKPMADSPKKFSLELIHLKKILNLKMVAGCCGTTSEHLKYIAQASHFQT